MWTCLAGQAIAAPASDPARKQAAAAVEAAARAFAAGDHARALAEFERAMALRPAPKLHFNIGVCHEELMLAARGRGDAAAERAHASAAIAAFNAYLREVPGAEDRAAVEDRIRGLGGTPLTQPQLKPIPPSRPGSQAPADGSASASEPATDPASVEPPTREFPPPPSASDPAVVPQDYGDPSEVSTPVAPDPVSSPSPDTRPLRGRFGATFGLLAMPQIDARRLQGQVQAALTLRGGGFLGRRGRLYLGGAVLVATAGQAAPDRYALSTQAGLLELEYGRPIGDAQRVALLAGVFGAGVREVVRVQGARPAACWVGPKLASQQGGGGAGGRVGLLVLLGARKNHELGVRLSTAVFGFSRGHASCGTSLFADLEVPRVRWSVHADTGYSFRF